MIKKHGLKTNRILCLISFFLVWLMDANSWAQVGAKIPVDDIRWISIGGGLRTSFSSIENGAPNGTGRSKKFEFESFRLYINSQVNKGIQFEFNTEGSSDNNVRVLDAVAKFNFSAHLNMWAGRFLPPSGRANFSGPYFLNVYDFPFAEVYPNLTAGRDEGVAVWGLANEGKLKYQLGAFQGRRGGPNQGDNLLYAGRITCNFWDPEPPIYYNGSTYFGEKNILALGLAALYQREGVGAAGNSGDFLGWNLDFLMERKMGAFGVFSLEGAYYKYNLGSVPDTALVQGNSYFAVASYLLPNKTGWGRIQPFYRFQSFDRDESNRIGSRGVRERSDIGFNYIIDGHNARISTFYARENPGPGQAGFDIFKIGLQVQFF